MTTKEAIIKSLENLKKLSSYIDVYNYIIANNYCEFKKAKTPKKTISAQLGRFIRKNDTRVKRVKVKGGSYLYYLSKYEQELNVEEVASSVESSAVVEKSKNKIYQERDLHPLLSSYLKNQNIYSKTIFHETSKNSSDNHQKWIHPDMIGIKFLRLSSTITNALIKTLKKEDTFKITSYEVKREINTDYELKKAYFQAVSNSSWANYGYLVAFDISTSLSEEIERLNQSFGIGVIEIGSNPYESKILFPSKYKELDFKTIDKLCKINKSFESFIGLVKKTISAPDGYVDSIEKELAEECDAYFSNDSEVIEYCKDKYIPIDDLADEE
jgi:hypothetical protein